MKTAKIHLLIAFISFPALAQEMTPLPPECNVLKEHVAKDDVAYQAGVDVHGKAVVPADINAPVMDVPETMVVPLTVDLAKRLSFTSASAKGIEMEGTMGFLEISKNGRVTFNDKDVTSQVYVFCGQKPPENLAPVPVLDNGQKPADIIKLPPAQENSNPAEKTPPSLAPKHHPLGKILEGGDYNDE